MEKNWELLSTNQLECEPLGKQILHLSQHPDIKNTQNHLSKPSPNSWPPETLSKQMFTVLNHQVLGYFVTATNTKN